MITIKKFGKKANNTSSSSSSSGGFATTIINNTTGDVDGVYLWGQYHDHKNDINGDLTSTGKITSNSIESTTGNITTVNSTNINSTNGNITNLQSGIVNVSGKLTAGEIESTYGNITTIDSTTINATTGNFDNLYADYLEVLNALITNLSSTNITTDYLTVTKAAHFFKLIIDEIKASQGQIIITPANAIIDKVVTLNNGNYKCYFRANDEDRKIYQSFEINDQIVCQTFNVAEGVNYNVDNKYYWRLCTEVSQSIEQTEIDGQTVDCHWIILSDTDKDSGCISIPEAGDNIVLLGNRSDTTRQAAITIGAYNNPYLDSGISAPFIIQYDGINDYNLSNHRLNIISNGLNQFKGSFSTNTGDDIEQLIHDVGQGVITYVHQAYSNSSDGRLNFSKTYFTDALYIGFCSNHTESDSSLTYSDYTWARLKGVDGTDADGYKLVPIQENVPIDKDGKVGVSLRYNILHTVGTTTEVITASTSGYYVRFKPYKTLSYSVNYTNLSTNTTTPYYQNANYESNWKTNDDHLVYLEIQLVDSSENIYDRRIVYAELTPAASFTITDNIISTVQGNYNELRGDINTNTNSISTIEQNYNSISQTVSSHTTSINTLTGQVTQNTTDIGNLTLTSQGLSSQISKYSGVQLFSNWWTKADLTAAEYDSEYQEYDIVNCEYNGHDYYDVFSNVLRLEEGHSYVFSFYTEFILDVNVVYSSTNGNPADFESYINIVRHTDSEDTYLDNPREYYTFTVYNTGYYAVRIGTANIEILDAFARPQFELGDVPTVYNENSSAIESEIIQKADEIYLGVANTGIDITNGKINLNSTNTNINGNLRINSADSGFELYDGSDKVIQIDNDAIGSFDYEEYKINYLQMVVTSAVEQESGMAILGDNGTSVKQLYANTIIDFTQLFIMSTLTNNATIKLNLYKNVRSTPEVTNYPEGDILDQDWELVSTITKTQSGTEIDYLNDGMYKVAIAEDGYYCFTFTVKLSSYSENQYYSLSGNYYINQTDYTHIASDGVNLTSPTNASLLMTDDAFKLRYKDNEITVGYDQTYNNDYIKLKNKNTELSIYNNKVRAKVGNHVLEFNEDRIIYNNYPLNRKYTRIVTATTVTATMDDEFIIINNSSTTTLNLDSTAAKYSGHTIIVKHNNGNTVNVTGSVIDYDSGSIITNKSWNDRIPRQFVYCGSTWYIMKLG